MLWTILIGLAIGFLARFLMPSRDPGGFITTVLIGIVGAVIATSLERALGFGSSGASADLIAAVFGAVFFLLAVWLPASAPARLRRH